MTFYEIADYLGISEDTAKSLARCGALPGTPSGDNWETTLAAVERWYIGITGKEWADLTNHGRLEPLEAVTATGVDIKPAELSEMLMSLETEGYLTIDSDASRTGDNMDVIIAFAKTINGKPSDVSAVGRIAIENMVLESISLVHHCEKLIQKSLVQVSILDRRWLVLRMVDDLSDVPQRHREIVRYHLLTYARRLTHQLAARSSRNEA